MNRSILPTALAATISLALGACQQSAPDTDAVAAADAAAAAAAALDTGSPAPAAPTDLEQLAERLVTQSAAVQAGDAVLITGRVQDAALMENIAVHVAKVGGFPLVTYSSDRLSKRLFFDVPAEYDSQIDALGAEMAKVIDVVINLGNATSENLFEGADPARMAARNKASEPVAQAFMNNNIRRVEVGNNLYPTPWRAERYGMAESALSQLFWNGVNVDYSELQTRGAQVRAALAGGNEIRVTHPNGTDLRLRIQGRPVLVSDGMISAEDLKQGGPALAVYLPAGEVYTTPVPGTAEGTIVDSGTWYRGKPVEQLTLTVSGGKVTAMSGSGPGYVDMKAEYDAVADARKDMFGYIDFGINPSVRLPAESKMGNWVPAGAVTVGTGSNDWAGGDNTVPYGINVFLPGSTVTLDGKTIVEAGQLRL